MFSIPALPTNGARHAFSWSSTRWDLVRGAQQLEQYVNDRPYVSSSYLTVAMGRIFGTALAGNCQKRPELVDSKLPLEIAVEVIRAGGGADILHKLFEPLGYRVGATPIPLDEKFADWGASPYFRLTLDAHTTVHDVLSHLYVLLPVLDNEKHYYIGDAEVDKLLRRGEGWLGNHPHRELIVQRYLKRKPSLVDQALTRLLDEENAAVDAGESRTEQAALAEKDLERPMTAPCSSRGSCRFEVARPTNRPDRGGVVRQSGLESGRSGQVA